MGKKNIQTTSLWTKKFISIALVNLTVFTGFSMLNTGMPVYAASLGASDVIAGLVTTFSALAALFIRPFTGILLDVFGRKGILISSIASMVVIIALYAVLPVLSVILVLRLFHGLAWGLSSTTVSTIAADIIPQNHFAEGMGYFSLAVSLAFAVAPAMSITLLQNIGVVPVIIVAATSTLISLVLACFQKPQKTVKLSKRDKLTLSGFVDKRALLPAGIMLLINVSYVSVATFIALHGYEKGVGNISLYFTVYALVTLFSRPILGKIIDKTGYFMPGILASLGVAATLVTTALAENIAMFCVAGVFAGLGVGAIIGTLQAMAISAVPPERRGVATSTFLFGMDAGWAGGAVFAGAVADMVGYSNMYLVMAVFPLIACLVFIIAGKKRIARYSVIQNDNPSGDDI